MIKPPPGSVIIRPTKLVNAVRQDTLRNTRPVSGEIIVINETETLFKVGDKIVYNSKYAIGFNPDGDNLYIVNICDILVYE